MVNRQPRMLADEQPPAKAPTSDGATSRTITAKGERTRSQLLAAAQIVFEEDGYLDARISDISRRAGTAYGTFYTYFRTKEDVFREVAERVVDELYESTEPADHGQDPVRRVREANEQFLASYRNHAAFMRVIEQVATMNADFEVMRRNLRKRAAGRVERSISKYIAAGYTDPALDPHIAAHALVGMIYYFAYAWLSLGEPFDAERSLDTLTLLWTRALGLDRTDIAAHA